MLPREAACRRRRRQGIPSGRPHGGDAPLGLWRHPTVRATVVPPGPTPCRPARKRLRPRGRPAETAAASPAAAAPPPAAARPPRRAVVFLRRWGVAVSQTFAVPVARS